RACWDGGPYGGSRPSPVDQRRSRRRRRPPLHPVGVGGSRRQLRSPQAVRCRGEGALENTLTSISAEIPRRGLGAGIFFAQAQRTVTHTQNRCVVQVKVGVDAVIVPGTSAGRKAHRWRLPGPDETAWYAERFRGLRRLSDRAIPRPR